jgi:hypothetical protein
VRQSIFTVVADIEAARVDGLRQTLSALASDPGGHPLLPFAQFDQLHFASLVLAAGPTLSQPKLIFEANVDGTAESWLTALTTTAPAGLDALYAGSPGYPGSAAPDRLRAWLAARVVRPGAYHIGATGRSLERIRQEHRLHRAIGAFLDQQDAAGELKGASPETIRSRIVEFAASDPALRWAGEPAPPRETSGERIGHRARAAAAVAAALALSPVLVPVVLVAGVILVVREQLDAVQSGPPSADHVRAVEADEDRAGFVQNHLASVIPVKAGRLRAVLLPVVLYALNLIARINSTKGKLGGIPSIHFAHWALIDDGRHLVFLSNYDGSWQSYLGDFVDKAAVGLTAVWSNTVKFPRTRLLAFRGAADGPRFLHWARASQCRTDVWYSAYPELGMSAIDNNSAIREDLFRTLNPEETQRWLARL